MADKKLDIDLGSGLWIIVGDGQTEYVGRLVIGEELKAQATEAKLTPEELAAEVAMGETVMLNPAYEYKVNMMAQQGTIGPVLTIFPHHTLTSDTLPLVVRPTTRVVLSDLNKADVIFLAELFSAAERWRENKRVKLGTGLEVVRG